MKKRILSIVLIVALVASLTIGLAVGLTGCDPKEDTLKIGLICLHDENSTYDQNFIDAMERARVELGLDVSQIVIKKNIPEGPECYDAAVELAEDGCNIIFADSFGHEDHMIRAAKEYTDVQFCHATGTKAHTENLANYHNAFASIYEGRYLAGVAAGLKLQELGYGEGGSKNVTNPKVGYVGAFTYAEVISGYTSWFLGVRSIIPGATMNVTFTGSWYDETGEKAAAEALIESGCVLVSQHADSWGAPTACKEHNIPNVTYNVSTEKQCAGTYIAGSRINWTPYYVYAINQVKAGKEIAADWTGTLSTGSVELLEIGSAAAAGTKEKLDDVKAKLENGTLHVFDLNSFTVGGAKLTTFPADIDSDKDNAHETNVDLTKGYIDESSLRSAPYFDLRIDGITLNNEKY